MLMLVLQPLWNSEHAPPEYCCCAGTNIYLTSVPISMEYREVTDKSDYTDFQFS